MTWCRDIEVMRRQRCPLPEGKQLFRRIELGVGVQRREREVYGFASHDL